MGSKARGKNLKESRSSKKDEAMEFLLKKQKQRMAIGVAFLIVLSGFVAAFYVMERGGTTRMTRGTNTTNPSISVASGS